MVAPPDVGTVFTFTTAQLSRPLPTRPKEYDKADFETGFQVALRRMPRLQASEAPRCSSCSLLFRGAVKRHHCHSCGHIVCASCWSNAVVDCMQWEWCRICRDCFTDLKEQAGTPAPAVGAAEPEPEPEWAEPEPEPDLDIEPEPEPEPETVHGSSSTKLSVLGPVQLTQGAWVEDSASSTCMLADCGLGFSLTDSRRFRHHCRHCGLLVCAACFSADVESASGEGWLRICVVCAVALADEAVEQPDAQVEEIATVVHEMIQRTERRRDAERAREEGSLINAVKRNVQVVIDQRREKHNEWWQEWHNGGQNAAMLKQTTKPCVKCEVPIVSLGP